MKEFLLDPLNKTLFPNNPRSLAQIAWDLGGCGGIPPEDS
jgi:hypothetical protein